MEGVVWSEVKYTSFDANPTLTQPEPVQNYQNPKLSLSHQPQYHQTVIHPISGLPPFVSDRYDHNSWPSQRIYRARRGSQRRWCSSATESDPPTNYDHRPRSVLNIMRLRAWMLIMTLRALRTYGRYDDVLHHQVLQFALTYQFDSLWAAIDTIEDRTNAVPPFHIIGNNPFPAHYT
jgi:hypothetical protein